MRKIEPGDAARIWVPETPAYSKALFDRVDDDLRRGEWEAAVDRVSAALLSSAAIHSTRTAWKNLARADNPRLIS